MERNGVGEDRKENLMRGSESDCMWWEVCEGVLWGNDTVEFAHCLYSRTALADPVTDRAKIGVRVGVRVAAMQVRG